MNRRERLMLMVAIVLLGGIVFKFMIHDPKQAEYNTLVVARDAAAAELARDEQVVARAEKERAEYDRLRAHIAEIERKLPQRKEIPALLTAMEHLTKQVGVTLSSIKPGPLSAVAPAPTGQGSAAQGSAAQGSASQGSAAQGGQTAAKAAAMYSSMPVDLVLGGTFAQTLEYLRDLRSFPRLLIVDSVSLSPQGPPNLGVTIHAEIYTLGASQAPTGGTH